MAEALADTRVVTLNGALDDDALALKDGRVARRLADRGRSRRAHWNGSTWNMVASTSGNKRRRPATLTGPPAGAFSDGGRDYGVASMPSVLPAASV